MSRVYFIYKAALLAIIVCFIAFADAYSEDLEGREIVVTSVSLEVDSQTNTALFKGSVVAKVDFVTIYADRMKISYSDSKKKVVEIQASGNVRVSNEEKVIFSKDARYVHEEEKIIFTGTPKVVEGENIITGTKIIYFLKDDRAIVEGSKVVLKNSKKKE